MTQVQLQQNGKTLTAKLSGEIDHHWAGILREKIDEHIQATRPAVTLLDFFCRHIYGFFRRRAHSRALQAGQRTGRHRGCAECAERYPPHACFGGHRFKKRRKHDESVEHHEGGFPQPQCQRGVCAKRGGGLYRPGGPHYGRTGRHQTAVSEAVTKLYRPRLSRLYWLCHYHRCPAGGRRAARCRRG